MREHLPWLIPCGVLVLVVLALLLWRRARRREIASFEHRRPEWSSVADKRPANTKKLKPGRHRAENQSQNNPQAGIAASAYVSKTNDSGWATDENVGRSTGRF